MPDRKKKKKWIILLGAVGFFLVLLAVSVEVTSTSRFCATCHYMKSFYQSWKTSSHKNIECNVCHYPPGLRSKIRAKFEGLIQVGRYWSKLYLKAKPWAEIPDESCLRPGCHEKRLLEGQAKFKKVVFDHKIHLTDLKRGKQLRCTSCHSQIVQGEHITVTEGTCFICHFKESAHYPKISDCAHCHKREALVSEKTSRFNHAAVFNNGFECTKCHSQVILGDGAVRRKNCYKCHFERDRLEKYNDTDLVHKMHISSHKIECDQCHLEIQHKIVKDIETIADCRACHVGFHQAQKILYTGEGGKGVSHPMPNAMLTKGLSCKGCHIFHEEAGGKLIKSETLVSKDKACESCHGKGFSRILKQWQVSTEKKLVQIQNVYERARQEILRAQASSREKALPLLEDAAFNINVVERGKSVHNVAYAQELIRASFLRIEEALRAAGSSYRPQKFLPEAGEIPTQCSSCHAGIEEINGTVFGMSFPHKPHLIDQKIECAACHSNARKHGEFIGTKKNCASCHHQDTNADCGRCHKLQQTFYAGGELDGYKVPKDVMAEASASCADCHLSAQKQITRPRSAKCADCHEESYKKTFDEWQNSTKKLLNSLTNALLENRKLTLTPEVMTELERVEQTLQKIELDGSSGIHNQGFFEETLTNLIKKVNSFGKKPEDE